MPRRPRPPETSRSEHWLRVLVNTQPGLFQHRFAEATGIEEPIEWLSPLKQDEYAEYYDTAFLERIGLTTLAASLKEFWPRSGPRWDGLARTASGHIILVEAKAHMEEVISDCGAGESSLKKISQRFEELKIALKIPESRRGVSWLSPYYQFCNRVAHLHFLRSQGVDAHLVFLHFADAPDVPLPVSVETWFRFSRHIRKATALENHALSMYDHEMTIGVHEL